jgi:hypothetical protein
MKKRILALALVAVAGVAAMAQTCIVSNEFFTEIDGHDSYGAELHNDSGVDILSHEFRVSFVNSNGAIVEFLPVDGCLRSLQDGAVDFYSATSSLPADRSTVALSRMANFDEDPDFSIGAVDASDIAISNVSATRNGETLTVTGTVTNNENDDLEEPAACAVVYNNDDRVVTTAKDASLVDLADTESDTFSLTIPVPDDSDLVDHVDIWVDGLNASIPVEPKSSEGHDVAIGTVTPAPTNTPTATPTP